MDMVDRITAEENLSTSGWTQVVTVHSVGYRDGFSVWVRDHQAELPASVVTGIMLVEQYRDGSNQLLHDEDIILVDIDMDSGLGVVIGTPSVDDFHLDVHSDFLRDPDVDAWDRAEAQRFDLYHEMMVHTIYGREVLEWLIATHRPGADEYRRDMGCVDLDRGGISRLNLLSAVAANTSTYRAAYRVDSYLPHPTVRRIAWYLASKSGGGA